MPKGHRSVQSQGHYRISPITTPTTSQYAPLPLSTRTSALPNTYYQQSPIDAMSQQPQYTNQQTSYSTGGPVQHPLQSTQYAPSLPPSSTPSSSAPLSSLRPSSGAWTPTDDQTLMAARSQGMNWAPIQQAYFPSKTPNACRKRHERLMERRSADDWDGIKLETMAKCYMTMRREIWSGLAAQTGEKWSVVEQKCMSQGLKNLQTSARACARRERLLDNTTTPSHHTPQYPLPHSPNPHNGLPQQSSAYHYTTGDDSGIAIEEYDQEYDNASERSGSYYGHQHSSSGGSGGSRGGSWMGGGGMNMGVNGHGGRLPSMDMGIDAIINRPGGGGGGGGGAR